MQNPKKTARRSLVAATTLAIAALGASCTPLPAQTDLSAEERYVNNRAQAALQASEYSRHMAGLAWELIVLKDYSWAVSAASAKDAASAAEVSARAWRALADEIDQKLAEESGLAGAAAEDALSKYRQ